MDYAKQLYVIEVRKLALGLTNSSVPSHYTAQERQKHVQAHFRENVAVALEEIEFTAQIIDELQQKSATE